jgi:hypothetical protein
MNTSNLVHQATASIALAWALFYALLKLAVFPVHFITNDGSCSCGVQCNRAGKHPRTHNGFKDATTDESIRNYF